MRMLINVASILTIILLLSGFSDFWQDTVMQIGKTTVYNTAIGSDVHRILAVHRSEAIKLNEFANSYNKIAYNHDRPQAEICKDLERLAAEEIKQRNKTFASMYETKCTPDATAQAPELIMTIWPQVRFDYRFIITFKPTP